MKHSTTSRSVVKTIVYRFLIICSDGIIIYALTHKVVLTLSVIGLSNIASTLLYFLHERAWSRITWGLSKKRLNVTK
ncbi:MAG TPA: DUF2061 domain-containing protein [Patescibacteria group bacterium]|nr:DUF2061 domain-containing protein [Patescibacteria group bacterium]